MILYSPYAVMHVFGGMYLLNGAHHCQKILRFFTNPPPHFYQKPPPRGVWRNFLVRFRFDFLVKV